MTPALLLPTELTSSAAAALHALDDMNSLAKLEQCVDCERELQRLYAEPSLSDPPVQSAAQHEDPLGRLRLGREGEVALQSAQAQAQSGRYGTAAGVRAQAKYRMVVIIVFVSILSSSFSFSVHSEKDFQLW